MITRADAIASLRPNSEWTMTGDVINWLDTENSQPTESEINAEVTRLQAEYDAKEYQRKRASEYPSWQQQLEKIYDDGIDAWKTEMVDPIKAKYPKPGE